MDGHAKPKLQEEFRGLSDGTVQPDQLPRLDGEGDHPRGSGNDGDAGALGKLKRLTELRDAGALSDDEFQEQKAKLLDQI